MSVRGRRSARGRKQRSNVHEDVRYMEATVPQQFNPLRPVRRTIRYLMSAASTVSLNGLSILLAGGAMCTIGNSTLRALYSAFRVHRLRLWITPITATSSPATVASVVSCSVSWGPSQGNAYTGASDSHTFASSNSAGSPLYIETRPPRGSAAAMWQMAQTDQMFEAHTTGGSGTFAALPAGTVMELDVSYVPASGEALTNFLLVTTGSLGLVYFPTLDNQNFKVLYPIGLSSTI